MLKKGFELSMTHGMIRKLKALLDTYIPYHFTLRFYMKAPIICIPVKFDRTELTIHTTRDNIIINISILYPSILMIFVSPALAMLPPFAVIGGFKFSTAVSTPMLLS